MKKLVSLLLAVMLVMALMAPAMADSDTYPGTITLTNTVKDKAYNLYRIFDLTGSNATEDGYGNIAYTIETEKWSGFFAAGAPGADYIVDTQAGDLNPISINGTIKYINITDDNVAAFAQDALAYAAKNKIAPSTTVTASGESTTVSNLPLGYYLIYPEGAADIKDGFSSICSLTSTVPTGTIAIKSEYPTVLKQITEEDADPATVNEAGIGDEIPYTITTKIPDMTGYETYFFVVHDTLSDGLTLNYTPAKAAEGEAPAVLAEGFTIKVGSMTLVDGTDYDVDVDEATNSFRIIFKNMVTKYANLAGTAVTIEYSATLNEDAVVNAPNTNTAKVEYSNDPYVEPKFDPENPPENPDDPEDENYEFLKGGEKTEPTGESTESETETYTTSLTIVKVDENGDILTGAEFQLTGDTNQIRITTATSFAEHTGEGVGEYFKLANGKYTKDAPTPESMKEDADGTYVVEDDNYEQAERITVGGTTYRAIAEGETVTATRYKHILGNEDKYANDGKTYDKTVTETMTGNVGGTPVDIKKLVSELDGTVTFEGLGVGEYTITETATPDGYNTIEPITFTVSFDATEKTFSGTDPINLGETKIVNRSGTELPSTGGVGTTIFYVLGGILLVGAAILLITKKRMSANN